MNVHPFPASSNAEPEKSANIPTALNIPSEATLMIRRSGEWAFHLLNINAASSRDIESMYHLLALDCKESADRIALDFGWRGGATILP